MDISNIKKMPIVVANQDESLFQASEILKKVIELLKIGTPNTVILEIIKECRSEHGKDWPCGWVNL